MASSRGPRCSILGASVLLPRGLGRDMSASSTDAAPKEAPEQVTASPGKAEAKTAGEATRKAAQKAAAPAKKTRKSKKGKASRDVVLDKLQQRRRYLESKVNLKTANEAEIKELETKQIKIDQYTQAVNEMNEIS